MGLARRTRAPTILGLALGPVSPQPRVDRVLTNCIGGAGINDSTIFYHYSRMSCATRFDDCFVLLISGR